MNVMTATKVWTATRNSPPAIEVVGERSAPIGHACRELQHYLERILQTSLSQTRMESGPVIRLRIAENAGLSDEGYVFELEDDVLMITGGGDLGVAFGVFAFLREAAGCVFAGLAPDGEFVPQLEEITFSPDSSPRNPVLSYRGLQISTIDSVENECSRLDWMLKNGLNYVMYLLMDPGANAEELDPQTGHYIAQQAGTPRLTSAYFDKWLLPEITKRGLKLDFSQHNFAFWISPARWQESHPEWFALHKGVRGKHLWQLCFCTSQPGVIEEMIRQIRTYLRAHPQLSYVGVVPEDGIGMCECEQCVAQDDHPSDSTKPWRGHMHPEAKNFSKSRRYAKIVNAVADSLREEFPKIRIVACAYVDLQWPAPDIKLAPNVVLWLAIYWRDGARPLEEKGTSEMNRFFSDLIHEWRDYLGTNRLAFYEYYMGMNAQLSLPYPMWNVIPRDWQNLNPLGIVGASIQCMTNVHHSYALNLMAFANAGWGNYKDAALLDKYLQGMFGAAGPALKPIHEAWAEAVAKIAAMKEWNDSGDAHFLDGNILKPDARNIVYLMSCLPPTVTAAHIANARAQFLNERERRQLSAFENYLNYCHLASHMWKLLDALEAATTVAEAGALREQAAAALSELIACHKNPLGYAWIAAEHIPRWGKLLKSSEAKWVT